MTVVSLRLDADPKFMKFEVERLIELQRLLLFLEEDVVRPELLLTAFEIAEAYKSYVRRVTGYLHSQVSVEDAPIRVVSAAPYAIYVERGTAPHIIEPKKAKALRFVVNGKVIFAKRVRHPGTQAQYAMRLAKNDVMPGAIVRLDAAINDYLKV